MIQRIQSLWLLMAAVCTFLTFKFPFYSGTFDSGYENLDAAYSIPVLLLTALSGTGCIIIIFLHKKRNLQIFLTFLAFIIAILNIYLYFRLIGHFNIARLSFTAILYFAVPVFLFLAARGIRKDAKLVKNLERLR